MSSVQPVPVVSECDNCDIESFTVLGVRCCGNWFCTEECWNDWCVSMAHPEPEPEST